MIREISSVCVYLPQNLQSLDARMSVWKTIKEIKKRTKGGFPLLDPIEDMGIKDKTLIDIIRVCFASFLAVCHHIALIIAMLHILFRKSSLLRNKSWSTSYIKTLRWPNYIRDMKKRRWYVKTLKLMSKIFLLIAEIKNKTFGNSRSKTS